MELYDVQHNVLMTLLGLVPASTFCAGLWAMVGNDCYTGKEFLRLVGSTYLSLVCLFALIGFPILLMIVWL